MKKGRDYKRLRAGGLPVPEYDVFDGGCLRTQEEAHRLSKLVRRILTEGSGHVGVRTEPKQGASQLGNYPHIMPLASERAVRRCMEQVLREHPEHDWWFLVNEAFTEYDWNAVVMLTNRVEEPGGPRLIGEVNDQDSVPLRHALAISDHCVAVPTWHHADKQCLRTMILDSGLLEQWMEVSAVRVHGARRKVFWGFR